MRRRGTLRARRCSRPASTAQRTTPALPVGILRRPAYSAMSFLTELAATSCRQLERLDMYTTRGFNVCPIIIRAYLASHPRHGRAFVIPARCVDLEALKAFVRHVRCRTREHVFIISGPRRCNAMLKVQKHELRAEAKGLFDPSQVKA